MNFEFVELYFLKDSLTSVVIFYRLNNYNINNLNKFISYLDKYKNKGEIIIEII